MPRDFVQYYLRILSGSYCHKLLTLYNFSWTFHYAITVSPPKFCSLPASPFPTNKHSSQRGSAPPLCVMLTHLNESNLKFNATVRIVLDVRLELDGLAGAVRVPLQNAS